MIDIDLKVSIQDAPALIQATPFPAFILTEVERLSPAIRLQWQRMYDQHATAGTSFASPTYFDFLSASPKKHGNPRLFTIRCRESGKLLGFMPVRDLERPFVFSIHGFVVARLGPRCLKLLGQPISSMGPLPFDKTADAVLSLLECQPSYSGLLIPEMSYRDGLWHAFADSAARSGYLAYLPSGIRERHFLPLPASLDQYFGYFSGKHRYNIRRQERRLSNHLGTTLELLRIENSRDIPRFLTLFAGLVGQRTARIRIREMVCEDLAENGLLLCYVLVAGQQAVAVMSGTRVGSTLRVHKLDHDHALAHFSPGACMLHRVVGDLIERAGVSVIDFGYGSIAVTTRNLHLVDPCADALVLRPTNRLKAFKLFHSVFRITIHAIKALRKAYSTKAYRAPVNHLPL